MTAIPSSLSVVIPVYNGAGTVGSVIDRLLTVLHRLGAPFEIVLVNDGSRDDSWAVIRALALAHAQIVGVDLMRNYGQHNALLCGIRAARHDVIVTMDDDLQQPPEEIPRLLEKLREGYDVVYGTPDRERHGFWRNASSRLTKVALALTIGAEVAPLVSAFRAIRSSVKPAFTEYRSPLLSIDVLLTWATTRIGSVVVRREPRDTGGSNYRLRGLIRHSVNMLTGFSIVPLQLATIVGFLFTLFGIALLVFVVGRFLVAGVSVPGFPFLASVIAIFSGAQLFALGIIGEYLGRMHLRAMERPPYIVRTSTEAGRQT